MSRRLDPDSGESFQLAVRVPLSLREALDREAARLQAACPPGVRVGRSDAVRAILILALAERAAPTVPTAPTTPTSTGTVAPAAHASPPGPTLAPVPAPEVPATESPPRTQVSAPSAPTTPTVAATGTPGEVCARCERETTTGTCDGCGISIQLCSCEEVIAREWRCESCHTARPTPGAVREGDAPARPKEKKKSRSKSAAPSEPEDTLARYQRAIDARTITHRGTAREIGCSETALRRWASGEKGIGAELSAKVAALLPREAKG